MPSLDDELAAVIGKDNYAKINKPMSLDDELNAALSIPEGRTFTGTVKDAGVVALKGLAALQSSAIGLADSVTGGYAGKGLEAIGINQKKGQEALSGWYSDAQQQANANVHNADGFVNTLRAIRDNPSVIPVTIGESIPQIVGGGLVARSLVKGAGMVPYLAGAVGEGVMGAGSAIEQTRGSTADGLVTPKQILAGELSGVGTAAFGAIGGKLANRLGVDNIDTMLAGGSKTVGKGSFLRQMALGGISEGVFEELPQSIQEQMWQNYATDKPVMAGVGNAAATGLVAGVATGGAVGGFNVNIRNGQVTSALKTANPAKPDAASQAAAMQQAYADEQRAAATQPVVPTATVDTVTPVEIHQNATVVQSLLDKIKNDPTVDQTILPALEKQFKADGNLKKPAATLMEQLSTLDTPDAVTDFVNEKLTNSAKWKTDVAIHYSDMLTSKQNEAAAIQEQQASDATIPSDNVLTQANEAQPVAQPIQENPNAQGINQAVIDQGQSAESIVSQNVIPSPVQVSEQPGGSTGNVTDVPNDIQVADQGQVVQPIIPDPISVISIKEPKRIAKARETQDINTTLSPVERNAIHDVIGWDAEGHFTQKPLSIEKVAKKYGMKPDTFRKKLSRMNLTAKRIKALQVSGTTLDESHISELMVSQQTEGEDGTSNSGMTVFNPSEGRTVAIESAGDIKAAKLSDAYISQYGGDVSENIDLMSPEEHARSTERTKKAREELGYAVAAYSNKPEGKTAEVDYNDAKSENSPEFNALSGEAKMDWYESYAEFIESHDNAPSWSKIEELQRDFERQNRNTPRPDQAQPELSSRGKGSNESTPGTNEGTQGADNRPAATAPAKATQVVTRKKRVLQKSVGDTTEGTSEDSIRKAITDLIGFANSPKIIVVKTAEDAAVASGISNSTIGDTAQAFVTGGKAYFIADNIEPGTERSVFMHEVGSHLGIDKILTPQQHQQLSDKVKAWAVKNDGSIESTVAKAATQRVADAGVTDQQMNHEVIAYFIEEAIDHGINPNALGRTGPIMQWLRTVMAAFKNALRKLNFSPEKLTAQDIVDMANGAAHIALNSTSQVAGKPDASYMSRNIPSVDSLADTIPGKLLDNAIVGYVMDNGGDLLTRAELHVMTVGQITRAYENQLPALRILSTITYDMRAMATRIERSVREVATNWRFLDGKTRNELNSLTKDATISGIHPNKPFADQHLAPALEDYYNTLAARYKSLGTKGQAVYTDAQKVLSDNWKERGELYKDLVTKHFDKKIEAVKSKMKDVDIASPEYKALVKQLDKYVADRAKSIKDADASIHTRKGPYSPLVRFGKHIVIGQSPELIDARAALNNGRGDATELKKQIAAMERSAEHYVVSGHESAFAANRYEKQLSKNGMVTRNTLAKLDNPINTLRKNDKSLLNEIEDELLKQFDKSTGAQEQIEQVMSDIWYALQPEHSAISREAKRKGIAGASDDMLRAFAMVGTRDAHFLSRLKYGADITDALFKVNEQAGDNKELQLVAQVMEKHHIENNTYDEGLGNDIASAVTKLSYIHHLLGSPAYIVMNSLQVPLIAGPVLSGEHGEIKTAQALPVAARDALVLMGKSVKSHRASGKGHVWKFELDTSKLNSANKVNELAMIEQLTNWDKINLTIAHDLGVVAHGNDISLKTNELLQAINSPVHHIEVFNRVTTALAAYRLAIKDGKSHEEAMQHAANMVDDTQIDYSPENTALMMKKVFGSRALARMMFQFKKYQQGIAYLWLKNAKQMFVGEHKTRAMRTVAWLSAAAVVTAGVRGLPISFPLLLLQAAMGDPDDDDPEIWWRNILHDMFGDRMGTAVASGFPALAGVDLSTRLGSGDLFNPIPFYKGWDDKSTGLENTGILLANIAGAGAGTLASYFDAIKLAKEGKVELALEKVAKSPGDIMKAFRYADEGLKTRSGVTVIPASSFSTAELIQQGLGTAPRQVTDYYQGNAAMKDKEAKVKALRKSIIDRAVDGEDVTDERAAFNEKYPHAKQRITLSTIAKAKQYRRRAERQVNSSGLSTGKALRDYADSARFIDDGVTEEE